MQAIQDADDALSQGRAAHDTVVDHHQVIHERLNAAIGNVIDVGGQVVTAVALGDEGTQLDVFDRHFLAAHPHGEDLLQLLFLQEVTPVGDPLLLQFVQVVVQPLLHSEVGHLGGVGDKREDRMVNVMINGTKDRLHQVLTHPFPFLIYIHIAAAREVDPLKRTGAIGLRGHDLLRAPLAQLVDKDRLAPIQLMDVFHMHVHDGLDHGALRRQHDDFIVGIIKGGTNAPWIAHAERLAATGDATNHEASIPSRHATAQDVRQIHMLLDRLRDLHTFQALAFIALIQSLHLAIQTMAELL